MKKFAFAAALLAALPAVASAQETAPDGTDAFGIEPYVGVLGGYHTFDRGSEFGRIPGETIMNGALISVTKTSKPTNPAIGTPGIAIMATSSARPRSQTIMTLRRGHRSARPARVIPPTNVGTTLAAKVTAASSGDPVRSNTSSVSATRAS